MRWRIKWCLGPKPLEKRQSTYWTLRTADAVFVVPVSSRNACKWSGVATARSSDWCEVCHGAHFGEGPVLAILTMLTPKRALRVAPGGSAPLFPLRCAPRLRRRQVGTGKQACRSNRKAGLARPD